MLACWRMGAVALPCNPQLRRKDLALRAAAAEPGAGGRRGSATSASCPTASPTWTWTTSTASSTRTCPGDAGRGRGPRPERPGGDRLHLGHDRRAARRRLPAALPRRPADPGRALVRRPRRRGRLVHGGARAGRSRPATPSSRPGWAAPSPSSTTAASTPPSGCALCAELGVNVLCQAPTEYRMLAKHGDLERVAGLRRLVSAGEPIEPEVIRLFRERLGTRRSPTATARPRPARSPASGPGEDDPARDGSMGRPLPGHRDPDRRGRAAAPAPTPPPPSSTTTSTATPLRRRVVADRRPGPRGRGGLPLVRGPRRRPDPLLRLPDRPLRGRVGAGLPPGGRRGRGGRRARPRARLGGPRDRRPRATARALRGARRRAPGARQSADRPLQVPADRRVRRRAAEDAPAARSGGPSCAHGG